MVMKCNYVTKLKENLIGELSIRKAALEMSLINEDEYNVIYDQISKNRGFSDYVDKASDVASAQICCLVGMEMQKGDEYKQGRIILNPTDKSGNRFCDVVVVSKKNIHAMKIVSMECDFIEVDECEDMMEIAYRAVDEYLCETSSDSIDLTIIQPNLLTSSSCTVNIDWLLDEFDKALF